MPRSVIVLLLLAATHAGCAVNLSEGRSAKVLRGGEVQVIQANNVVVPTGQARELIAPAKAIERRLQGDTQPNEEERQQLLRSAVAISLAGPGYGSHVEIALGLGYRYDVAARVGNGIYALTLRRGFDLGSWHAALGARAAYNSGGSIIPYVDMVNTFAKVSSLTRWDAHLFAQAGREWGEWGKLWFGAKAIYSPFSGTLDATRINLGSTSFASHLLYAGGFLGAAVGYRWVHFFVELTALYAHGSVRLFDHKHGLYGLVLAPTWGLQGTF